MGGAPLRALTHDTPKVLTEVLPLLFHTDNLNKVTGVNAEVILLEVGG